MIEHSFENVKHRHLETPKKNKIFQKSSCFILFCIYFAFTVMINGGWPAIRPIP